MSASEKDIRSESDHGTDCGCWDFQRLKAENEQLREDAYEVVLDALAWLDPESGKRLMASPSYRRFKAALKS